MLRDSTHRQYAVRKRLIERDLWSIGTHVSRTSSLTCRVAPSWRSLASSRSVSSDVICSLSSCSERSYTMRPRHTKSTAIACNRSNAYSSVDTVSTAKGSTRSFPLIRFHKTQLSNPKNRQVQKQPFATLNNYILSM